MLDKHDKQYIEETFGRYTQVMKEEFISQIRPIAEMQKHHGEKIKSLVKKVDALFEMVAKNTENIESIETKLTKIEADIAIIKSDLITKVDLKKIETLEKNIVLLKQKMA